MREFWIQFVIAVFCFFIAILCSSDVSLGFPQNTRLGYANCNTCHYAPTGGGALRPYGKSTAGELSTWSTGIDPADTKFISGGDLRYLSIQNYPIEGETTETKFLMAAELELGYEGKYFDYLVEIGQYHSYPYPLYGSYRHYIQTSILGLGIRFGKFAPAFGITTEDHTLPGRNTIGFDKRDAGVATELSYSGKTWNYAATLLHGCQGILSDLMQKDYCKNSRTGFVGHVGWAPSKPVFLSGSYAYTQTEEGESQYAYGVGWVIGGKHLYTMGEYTHNDQATEAHQTGWVDLIASYKGLDFGGTYRILEEENVPGVKFRWLPIDHTEFTAVYLIQEKLDRLIATGHLYF